MDSQIIRTLFATAVIVTLCVDLVFFNPVLEASELPTVEELFEELGLSASDRRSLREGKIVTWLSDEGSEGELALGLALLVKAKNEDLVQLFREATGLKKAPSIMAYGKIVGEGTLADFERVKLVPNGDKEARRYLELKYLTLQGLRCHFCGGGLQKPLYTVPRRFP